MPRRKTYADELRRSGELRLTARDGHTVWVDAETSDRMAGVRQKGTSPELIVRGLVSAVRHRYRVENRDLPGSPDLANRSKKWAIFVHGCFWHRHSGCPLTTTPKRNAEFWLAKFARNVERDRQREADLVEAGYRVLIVWECETRKPLELGPRIAAWLQATKPAAARSRGARARQQ